MCTNNYVGDDAEVITESSYNNETTESSAAAMDIGIEPSTTTGYDEKAFVEEDVDVIDPLNTATTTKRTRRE